MTDSKPPTPPGYIHVLTDKVPPIVEGERDATRDLGGGFGPPRVPSPLPTGVNLKAETLRSEMGNFLMVVDQMFAQAEQQKSGMQLDEIELSVEVSGEGQVSLLGNGVKAAGKGAMTLKFKRSHPTPDH